METRRGALFKIVLLLAALHLAAPSGSGQSVGDMCSSLSYSTDFTLLPSLAISLESPTILESASLLLDNKFTTLSLAYTHAELTFGTSSPTLETSSPPTLETSSGMSSTVPAIRASEITSSLLLSLTFGTFPSTSLSAQPSSSVLDLSTVSSTIQVEFSTQVSSTVIQSSTIQSTLPLSTPTTVQSTVLSSTPTTVQSTTTTVQPTTVQSTTIQPTTVQSTTIQPTIVQSTVQSTAVLSTVESTTVLSTTTTTTPSTTPTSVLDQIAEFFKDPAILIAVTVGGSIIVILLCIIIVVCCCCCCCYCCRKRKYSVESSSYDRAHSRSNGDIKGTMYRPSISLPQQSYHYELCQVKEQREKLEVFAETELNDIDVDDTLHYQGHSQVQHSQQPYSADSREALIPNTQQSLSKLTPLNPSQLISQVQAGGISVDDEDDHYEREVPERESIRRDPRASGGGDSPFMHLSDNLPFSRVSRSQQNSQSRSSENFQATPPTQTNGEASQYSYLGLGVLHGSDMVYTNTNSILEDDLEHVRSDVGMVGIDKDLLATTDLTINSHGTTSPLVQEDNNSLDDTPTKEPAIRKLSHSHQIPKGERDFALLTSLDSAATGNSSKDKPPSSASKSRKLSEITSIRQFSASYEGNSSSTGKHSDLQSTPEKHRSHSLQADSFKRPPTSTSKSNSRLGKLTSLEYIRASLRMKLKKMTVNKDNGNSPDNNKKPLKSALRKTNSASSYDSSASNTYSNPHAHEYDDSPTHILSPHPPFMPPYPAYPPQPFHRDEYMGPMEPYNGAVGGAYPPYVPLDPYGFPLTSPHMIPMAYADQLSPILSVSQYDYHPGMRQDIGILPQYGGRPVVPPMGYPPGGDNYFPSQPPNYDDDDDDDIPYRYNDTNAMASQRSVRWNLEQEIIPPSKTPEQLTPSDDDER